MKTNVDYLENRFMDTLNFINNNGIDKESGNNLSQIIREFAPNHCGIDNHILAHFDNIDFVTEKEKGIGISQGNILTKKGIVYSRAYENSFEFKNNTYTYDIIRNDNNEFERTNFEVINSSCTFDKLDMFNFESGAKFFNINKETKSIECHNDIYNVLCEINQNGFNHDLSLKFNKIFKYIDSYNIEKILYEFRKQENNIRKYFRVDRDKNGYKLIPCIERGDAIYGYDENPFEDVEFKKNEFLLLCDKEKALDTIDNILSSNVYYEYSLKNID